jgi:hypothetical protein
MGWIKKAKADSLASDAKRALDEGHTVFVAQLRGSVSHSPTLSRPIPGVAEMIESVESLGWRLNQFTSVPYKDNMTTVCLFRLRQNPAVSLG